MSGEPERTYFNGSRTVDNRLDTVDEADSTGREEYRFVKAICAGGMLDPTALSEGNPRWIAGPPTLEK